MAFPWVALDQLLAADLNAAVRGTRDTNNNGGETINGATLPVPVYQLPADSEYYACDANVTTKLNYIGFAVTNTTDGNAAQVQLDGIVTGFSGLTPGVRYYVSDTAGTISTTPGTYEILVGIALTSSTLLIVKDDQGFIDSNSIQSAQSGTSGTTTGSFTVNTQKRAKLIRFDISLFVRHQTGANSTRIGTWKVEMDLINQRIIARQIYSTSSGNQTSPTIFASGSANLVNLLEQNGSAAFSSSSLQVTDGSGGSANVSSLVSTENAITLSYSLTANGGDKSGIAISSIIVTR